MELLLEIIFGFFLEVVIPVALELMVEFGIHNVIDASWARKTIHAVTAALIYLTLGVSLGLLTLLVFPHSFVRSERFHGISLIVAPVLAGLTMAAVGRWRARKGEATIRLDTFAYGFIFAFGLALMRFWFTA